jgi:hypothetical protein
VNNQWSLAPVFRINLIWFYFVQGIEVYFSTRQKEKKKFFFKDSSKERKNFIFIQLCGRYCLKKFKWLRLTTGLWIKFAYHFFFFINATRVVHWFQRRVVWRRLVRESENTRGAGLVFVRCSASVSMRQPARDASQITLNTIHLNFAGFLTPRRARAWNHWVGYS